MVFRWPFRGRTSGALLIVFLLCVWEVALRWHWIKSISLPPVSQVFSSLPGLFVSGEIPFQVWMTLRRMFIGYGAAAVAGTGVGLIMGYFRPAYNLLEPLTEILRPIPSPAYIPIAILFLGIDDEMKAAVIAFASFWPILLNSYSGVKSADPVQINTGKTFGLSSWKLLWQIVLPAATPSIFTGLRISLALSLIISVIAEMVASNNGIGFFILDAQRSFRIREMYAGIMVLGTLGYGFNWLFLKLEKKLMRWYFGATSRET